MTNIEKFSAALGDVPHTTDARTLRVKSRDRFALSPLLAKALAGKQAEIVVAPRTKEEAAIVARAAFACDVPLTPRGAGTANYGQSVPLHGGATLDLTSLSGVLWVRDGAIRALAGTGVDDVEAAARATGQELRFYPTTRREATIGGFIAGGTGGVGSITWGVLRDRGNMLGMEVLSVEAEPQAIELRGTDTRLVQQAYGTTGIITEVELALAPARPWLELVVTFPDHPSAIRHAISIGRETGLVKKHAFAYEWPIGSWFRPLARFVPQGESLVLAMIDAASMELYAAMVAEAGGTIRCRSPEGEGPYGCPLYAFTQGHTVQEVKRTVKDITSVGGMFRAPDLEEFVLRVHRRIRHTGPLSFGVRRWNGDLVCSGSTLVDFRDKSQLEEVARLMQEEGVAVANPHASNVRRTGKKEIGERDVAFKRRMDPKGLLNPGRFEPDPERDTIVQDDLDTGGWMRRSA